MVFDEVTNNALHTPGEHLTLPRLIFEQKHKARLIVQCSYRDELRENQSDSGDALSMIAVEV